MKNSSKALYLKILVKDFWLVLVSGFTLPFITYAQVHAFAISDVIDNLKAVISAAIPLAMGLALLYFIYGIAMYISASGDSSKESEGRMRMVWGVIALFVIVAVWGLVSLLQVTVFGTSTFAQPPQGPHWDKNLK